MADEIRKQVGPLAVSLRNASDNAAIAMKQARTSLAAAQQAFVQAQGAFAEAKAMLDPASPITYELNKTLEDISGAAPSTRELADFLQRNPSAVIRGRPTQAPMKHSRHLVNLASLWLTLSVLSACSTILQPLPDKSKYFLLTPISQSDAGSGPAKTTPAHSYWAWDQSNSPPIWTAARWSRGLNPIRSRCLKSTIGPNP